MDPEFSNKERANFFPIEMSPQIFYSDTREMLELQSSSKCVFFFVVVVGFGFVFAYGEIH